MSFPSRTSIKVSDGARQAYLSDPFLYQAVHAAVCGVVHIAESHPIDRTQLESYLVEIIYQYGVHLHRRITGV